MKRKASPLPFRPMKKVKVTTNQEKKKGGRKRKLSEANLSIDAVEPEKKKRTRKPKLPKAKPINDQVEPAKANNFDFSDCSSTVVAESSKPSDNLFTTLKLKWPKVSKLGLENNSSTIINMESLEGASEKTKKYKYIRKKKLLFEDWKCKRIDEYLTRCDKITTIPTADLETPPQFLSSDVYKSNEAVVVVQTLLDEIIDDIFTEVSDKNTNRFGANPCNLEFRDESVLLNHADDQLPNVDITSKVFDEISPTTMMSVESLESPVKSQLITNKSESRDPNISSDKNIPHETNVPTHEIESSCSSYKTTNGLSASLQKITQILEDLPTQSNLPLMDCNKKVSRKVFKKDAYKKKTVNYSIKGYFPKIKFCNHSKHTKHSKKTTKYAQETESVGKLNQESRLKKCYTKCSKMNSIGEENTDYMIDQYFSRLNKDTSDFKTRLETQKIAVGTLNSSGEENKNNCDSSSPSSPGKKPLVELQYSMLFPCFSS